MPVKGSKRQSYDPQALQQRLNDVNATIEDTRLDPEDKAFVKEHLNKRMRLNGALALVNVAQEHVSKIEKDVVGPPTKPGQPGAYGQAKSGYGANEARFFQILDTLRGENEQTVALIEKMLVTFRPEVKRDAPKSAERFKDALRMWLQESGQNVEQSITRVNEILDGLVKNTPPVFERATVDVTDLEDSADEFVKEKLRLLGVQQEAKGLLSRLGQWLSKSWHLVSGAIGKCIQGNKSVNEKGKRLLTQMGQTQATAEAKDYLRRIYNIRGL